MSNPKRQIQNGEFGGGISDDTDLLDRFPELRDISNLEYINAYGSVWTDAKGRIVAQGTVPSIACPSDLMPKTATVTLLLPEKFRAGNFHVVLDPENVIELVNSLSTYELSRR